MLAQVLLATLLLLPSPGSAACAELRSAHDRLLAASFTVQRHLTVTINDEVKMRETSRLDYRGGTLASERLEVELLDDNLVLEENEKDPALEMRLACADVTELGGGRYSIRSTVGKEQQELELVLDPERQVLRPAVWRSREKVRFLWKKLHIETEAVYSGFEWAE